MSARAGQRPAAHGPCMAESHTLCNKLEDRLPHYTQTVHLNATASASRKSRNLDLVPPERMACSTLPTIWAILLAWICIPVALLGHLCPPLHGETGFLKDKKTQAQQAVFAVFCTQPCSAIPNQNRVLISPTLCLFKDMTIHQHNL